MRLPDWLGDSAEGVAQNLALIGVTLGGVLVGVQRFFSGRRAASTEVTSTPASDLLQSLAAIAAEQRDLHRQTHEMLKASHDKLARLEEIDEQLRTVSERTRIIVDRPK